MAEAEAGKLGINTTALTTEEILREEAAAIHGDKAKVVSDKTGAALYRELNGLNSAALCLSGGGIRSAAFALGVIQALATHPRPAKGATVATAEGSLLSTFHYLSTVSGGGYIGSWLSAWIKRAGFRGVWQSLVALPRRLGVEPPEIGWLRGYSNFLTPRVGIASADSWAGVALYFRNLILNWFVIIPALCAVLILLKLLAIAVVWVARSSPQSCGLFTGIAPAAIGLVFLIAALRFTTRHRPTRGHSTATQCDFLLWDWLPALLSAFLLTLAFASPCGETFARNVLDLSWARGLSRIGFCIATGATVYVVAWLIARPQFRGLKDYYSDLVAWAVAGAVFGSMIGIGVESYLATPVTIPFLQPLAIVLLAIGLPWLLFSQLFADMIFAGLSSYEEESDADQEWLGRAAGWFLVASLLWFVVVVFVFARWDLVASYLQDYISANYREWLSAVGGVAGIVTWVLGQSGLSPATGEAKNKVQISAKVALSVAAAIFAVFLVIGTTVLLDKVILGHILTTLPFFKDRISTEELAFWSPEVKSLVFALIVVGVAGAGASVFVNINRFSLHALYRNRLIRAFLGASNPARHPNPFTDFDSTDNFPMKDLWGSQIGSAHGSAKEDWRPFHVINMTLNTVSPKKLAWQERKAESFTVSPLHSGSACKKFRPSAEYGHPDRGISIGTAMAISGAAVSPNMGYQSSPAGSFVLSLFNVRLGWWLGNPGLEGEKTYRHEGPRFALLPHIYETFGLTTDDRAYVYLSDGGHFENLALYEMVRRRCRFIIVCDAGCDPNFEFEDLGNAIRKIGIDLGTPIRFRGIGALKPRLNEKVKKCSSDKEGEVSFHAIGIIEYPAEDNTRNEGLILYIKPGYHQDKIANVGTKNYAKANPDFPHEGTGDQWFSESQFESYRALGFEIMDDLLNTTIERLPNPSHPQLDDIVKRLREDFDGNPVL